MTVGLATASVLQVEVDMVTVIGVGAWPQDSCEFAAGLTPNQPQELLGITGAIVILKDGNLATARKREGCHVNGIAKSMLAHLGAAHVVARAAGIGCGHINAHNSLTKRIFGGVLHSVGKPFIEGTCKTAIHSSGLAERDAGKRVYIIAMAHFAATAFMDINTLLHITQGPRIDQAG